MVWKVELDAVARKQLGKIGQAPANRIVAGLRKISQLADPRTRGKAMTGEWGGYWRFRFDDYRVIARIEDGEFVILVVAAGHRRNIYR